MVFLFQYDERQYLVELQEVLSSSIEVDSIRIIHSEDEGDYTDFEIIVFERNEDSAMRLDMSSLSKPFLDCLGNEIQQAVPKTFVANPYFDEMMIFFGSTVLTSQDKFIPISCDVCEKRNLYEKRDKKNKSDYISMIHESLLMERNDEWPFTDEIMLQFTISDKVSRLKEIDLDNVSKTIFDSLKNVVFGDDRQVVAMAGDKASVAGIQTFIVAIRRLKPGEKAVFQEYLFSSSKGAWREEYEKKRQENRQTRFVRYGTTNNK